MKPIYHPYTLWEDHQNGMFAETCPNPEVAIAQCSDLLRNLEALYYAMCSAADEWEHSAEMNLTNKSRNRQAWLGQAACCYELKAPDYITKLAWHTLTKEEQDAANEIADLVLSRWEKSYRGRCDA